MNTYCTFKLRYRIVGLVSLIVTNKWSYYDEENERSESDRIRS